MQTINDTPRARYGLIVPSSNRMVEPHTTRYTPADVACHVTRLRMTGPHFMPLNELLPKITEAAELLADAKCDPIVFHCTANSMSDGIAGEKRIKNTIEKASGRPAATTASATMAAFSHFNATRVVLVSPYPRASHEHELEFLTEAGCEIVSEKNLGLKGSDAYCGMPASDWFDTMLAMKNDKADIYFVSCANIQALAALEEMEEALGAPVVTSNQLVIWQGLRMAGIDEAIPGLGKLAA
jgi:maleate isomerase